MNDSIFPSIDYFDLTERQPLVSELAETAVEILQRLEPALTYEITHNWGKQSLHNEMSSILMGNGKQLTPPVTSALLEVFNAHSDRFKLEAQTSDSSWWHVHN